MSSYHQLSAISRLLASLRPLAVLQDPTPTLPAPRIPTAESNGGIRFKDISDPNVPVQVVIAAYPQIQINDSIELLWNARVVDTRLVTQEHIDQGSITLDVPSIAIQDGTPPVHYLVTSANGINQYKSFPLNIRVKTNVPGGVDPIPSTPEVNENLLAVTGVPELVDESNADSIVATVSPYLNMTAGDRINLSWGGYFYSHEIEAAQVDQPIALPIPRSIIENAGAGAVVIEYEIRDIVNNWSLWSIKFTPDVEIGSGLLRAPDALDLVAGKLDLAELGDKDARIRVRVYPDMTEGDLVALSWVARPPTGIPIEHSAEFPVGADDEALEIVFFVPNAIAKASAGGTVAVKYTVTSNRGVRHSRRTSFEVIGQVQRLPAPTFSEAVGGELDPANIPDNGATVTVAPWPNMASGDRLELFLTARDGNGAPSSEYFPVDIPGGQVGRPVVFTVSKTFFVPLVNGSVAAYYRVDGEDSESLHLRVVGEGGAGLPAPTVDGMVDDALDPDDVPTGTRASVPQYPGKAIGDRITLTWQGLPGATYSDYIDVTNGNHGDAIRFSIAYAPYVIGNLNSEVTVSYRVRRTGGDSANSEPLEFEVRRKAGEVFDPPTVLEAPNGKLNPINATAGATVRVEYDGMRSTDTLKVAWVGIGQADTWESEAAYGNNAGYVDFTVPVSVVAASQGKVVVVRYAVLLAGHDQPRLSLPHALHVDVLEQSALPQPRVPQANAEQELNLGTFQGDANAQLSPWPLIALLQRYWIIAKGTLREGAPYRFYIAENYSVSANNLEHGLDERLARAELEKLAHGSELRIEVSVAFASEQTENSALLFPLQVFTIFNLRELPAPTVIGASGGTISNPENAVTLLVPATANLRVGEKVRAVTGTLVTQPVIVEAAQEELKILVPLDFLERLEGSGIQNWRYEIEEQDGWTPSEQVQIRVNATTPLYENFDSISPFWLSHGHTVNLPSMRVTNEGAEAIEFHNDNNHPPIGGVSIAFRRYSTMSMRLKRNVRALSFDSINYRGRLQTIHFYETTESLGPFASLPITHNGIARVHYTSPGPSIRRITFSGTQSDGSLWIDNMTFTGL